MSLYANKFRPMNIGDIFDEVFDLYKRNFVVLAGVAGALYMPISLLQGALTFVPFAQFGIVIISAAVVSPFATAALCYALSETYLGKRTSIGGAFRFVGKRFWQYVGTWLLSGLVVLGAMVLPAALAAIPGAALYFAFHEWWPLITLASLGGLVGVAFAIILGLWFAFMPAVFVVEGSKYAANLIRSRKLIAGYVGKVFAVLLLVNLLVSVVSMAVLMPLGAVSGLTAATTGEPSVWMVLQSIVSGVVQSVLQPIALCAIILLYYDVRIRKEGFDLQLLAEELQSRPGSDTAYPAATRSEDQAGWGTVLGGEAPTPDLDEKPDDSGGATT